MDFITLFFIAVGLAMDAFAVSITSGLTIKKIELKHPLIIGLAFGFFQGLMPFLGWLGAFHFESAIKNFDHWIAFALLAFIGIKMIYESFSKDEDDIKNPLDFKILLTLSIATSIDALAVGVSFGCLHVSILTPIIVISLVCFVFSFVGVLIGKKLGHFFEKKIEIIGGLILIFIGVKILVEHLKLF